MAAAKAARLANGGAGGTKGLADGVVAEKGNDAAAGGTSSEGDTPGKRGDKSGKEAVCE
jgi:hypothetical protein